tara:strand:+ start:1128 stop:1490 length:363 start_codon:yes stop_codon:yes gene_type:complete
MIIEIPLENADTMIEMFGLPKPAEEQWVAVAALERTSVERASESTRAIQSAGMLCKNAGFGEWLKTQRGMSDLDPSNPDSIADGLRALLGIRSRTEMHNSPKTVTAFNRLKGEFDEWIMG